MASPAGFVIRRDVKLLNYNFLHTSITIICQNYGQTYLMDVTQRIVRFMYQKELVMLIFGQQNLAISII